ncbi:hypothetical protein HIM_07710 [Hirsutella minnesotensis 3608]|uniref:Filamentation protein n=1 Tax=Hirsutella minnesotensis 3608 TaxID=1043627 RepID=A0A0F7ZYR8_9HYPO|nr:hypothetical protein HIM_07710 [Hirsutella minnesotensis 3608]
MTTKADHYLEQLEHARCEGSWEAVPELVRKVRKHAPVKSCLALVAETECAISNATLTGASPSGADAANDLDVARRLPRLQNALEQEKPGAEDGFQAQVCVGWLYWVVGDYALAFQSLPRLDEPDTQADLTSLVSEWSSVCALKSAYLRANCLMRDGSRVEALAALKSAALVLRRVEAGKGVRKQLRYWSELFLTEWCVIASEAIKQGQASREDPSVLAPFRAWATYWDVMQAPVTGGFGFKGSVPRRQVWSDYYMALSQVLQSDLSYEPGLVKSIPSDLSARSQLRTEVKFAETAYRSLLLAETTFPRADERREEVEVFVKVVVENWAILCGRGWREEDLGQGGRSAISRGVLETLYSAATRTFHSTAILRSLFYVHISLAEFDLAFKAFDSYLEIVKREKARVEKTGEVEPSLDSDDVVLETMSQAIMALCRYGPREAGEKARRLGAELEDWLSRLPPAQSAENGTNAIAEHATKRASHPTLAPKVVALAWQAIGLSQAHWSRLTSEASSRIEIQSKAIRCLRKSVATEFGRSKDIRALFSLALLLAERRELTAAIELTRSALMSKKDQDQSKTLICGPYWQERALIPLWHLLALLLSARQDYAMAFRACEGALDQFKDPSTLFGRPSSSFRVDNYDGAAASRLSDCPRGLVDDMDDSEKEGILEIKITQLALIELTEGSDMAVNTSYELLTMFTRLFGSITAQETPADTTTTQAPRTSGTFRSIRGSIFGTKTDRTAQSLRQPSASVAGDKSVVGASRPSTGHSVNAARPAIQVTADGDNQPGIPRQRRRSSAARPRSESRRRGSVKARNRSNSRPRPETAGAVIHKPTIVDGDAFFTPAQELDPIESFPLNGRGPPARSSSSRGKVVSMNSYLATAKPAEPMEISTEITQAPPHLLPLIELPKEKQTARRKAILIKIWLKIAGFYRRAGMLEDSKGAIAEAQKLVLGLETDSSLEPTDAAHAGWAVEKNLDDLRGDVWTELGLLALAQGQPLVARSDLEQVLVYCPNHPAATVNLCNILLDISSETLLPAPVVPPLDNVGSSDGPNQAPLQTRAKDSSKTLPLFPLGLADHSAPVSEPTSHVVDDEMAPPIPDDHLPAPYKATRLPLVDRLAARDRAFSLLTGLTRLGSGWGYSDAWFALARAYEESGQPDKAKEVLWWCVELEEAMGVRDWRCVGGGGGYLI